MHLIVHLKTRENRSRFFATRTPLLMDAFGVCYNLLNKSGFIGGMNVRNRPFLMFLISFATLCFGYFVIRYILFDFHGMKQWPLVLLVGCVVVIVVSYLAHSKILPLVTSISYPLGFAVGAMFHTTTFDDAVGRTDNLWIIWTAVIMIAMIVSGIVEFIILKRKDS